jgi:hypothetical protein
MQTAPTKLEGLGWQVNHNPTELPQTAAEGLAVFEPADLQQKLPMGHFAKIPTLYDCPRSLAACIATLNNSAHHRHHQVTLRQPGHCAEATNVP